MSTSTRIKRVIPVALYTVFYLLCFSYLENRHVRYHIIDSSLDDKIPFCEYFIIPYLLWFLYIAVTVGYFLFFNENTTEFWSLILNLAIGMTLFLIVSYLCCSNICAVLLKSSRKTGSKSKTAFPTSSTRHTYVNQISFFLKFNH